jgi:hypothetical protein
MEKLKLNKKTLYIAGGATIIIAGITLIIINKAANKKLVATITKIVREGITQYGTIEDLKASVALDPKYWRTIPANSAASLLNIVQIRDIENDIYKAIKGVGTDRQAVITAFKRFKNKAQVSQVTEYFQKDYNKDLWQWLKETFNTTFGTIADSTAGGILSMGLLPLVNMAIPNQTGTVDEIKQIVELLPNY